ncbi:MAG: hypothetical protein P8N94_06645, partial [Gammaproteobacteria bacterium]|nr:hypothetical protein [Gammaproteobacteria bacterium]
MASGSILRRSGYATRPRPRGPALIFRESVTLLVREGWSAAVDLRFGSTVVLVSGVAAPKAVDAPWAAGSRRAAASAAATEETNPRTAERSTSAVEDAAESPTDSNSAVVRDAAVDADRRAPSIWAVAVEEAIEEPRPSPQTAAAVVAV